MNELLKEEWFTFLYRRIECAPEHFARYMENRMDTNSVAMIQKRPRQPHSKYSFQMEMDHISIHRVQSNWLQVLTPTYLPYLFLLFILVFLSIRFVLLNAERCTVIGFDRNK